MESTGTYPSSYINTVKGGATAPLAPLFLRPWPMQDTLRLEVELATTIAHGLPCPLAHKLETRLGTVFSIRILTELEYQ